MATENKPNLPKKNITPVVTAEEVIVKKKSIFTKLRDVFIAEDASKVGNYILLDVLVPSIKRAIVDIIKSSADMIFGTSGSSKNSSQTRYSYSSGSIPYINYSQANKRPDVPVSRSQYEVCDIVFPSRDKADKVLSDLEDIIEAYGEASVSDFCELTSQPYEYTAHNYGWKDLHDAAAIMTGDGWSLRLPKAKPLSH